MIIASRAHASRFLAEDGNLSCKIFRHLAAIIALLRQSAKTQRNCLARELREGGVKLDYVSYTKASYEREESLPSRNRATVDTPCP